MSPEELGPICEVFADLAMEMRQNADKPRVIDKHAVYQEANLANRKLIDTMLDTLVLPSSEMIDPQHFDELYRYSLAGESCLILMEHYSNFDISVLSYLLARSGRETVADAIIAMAGMKLNEDSGFVSAFAEAYTRIVIYPSRSLMSITDTEQLERETRRSREINMAATREMIRRKHDGKMVLLFPSGTRYREGRPETKRGVKEVDSYLKSFDWMVTVGVAGNVLRLDPEGNMSRDLACRDLILLRASEPVACKSFRDKGRATCPDGKDPKQHVADLVMQRLDEEHEIVVKEQTGRLKELAG